MSADTDRIEQGIATGALAFGILATTLPQVFTAVYGLGPDRRTRIVTRMWGTRTAAIGALWLLADSRRTKRTVITVATAIDVVDAALTASSSGLTRRTRVLGAATSAGFAAAGAYALTQA